MDGLSRSIGWRTWIGGLLATAAGLGTWIVQPLPTARGQAPPAESSRPATEVRGYACPVADQPAVIAQLREQFGAVEGFRVSADPTTAQLLVVAPPRAHAAIQQVLAPPPAPPTDPDATPRLWSDAAGADLRFKPATAASRTAATVDSRATTRFLLVRGDVLRLQQRLRTILGGRLRPLAQDGETIYVLEVGAQAVAELEFDNRRGGVLVTASERVLQQLVLLFRALEPATAAAGQRTAVVSIERSDPAQLRQTIEAFRARPPHLTTRPNSIARLRTGDWPW